jgi:hypothetical protein
VVELQEYYINLLLQETKVIMEDTSIDKREKFARITRLSNTVSHYFQIQSLDAANFQDLDLTAYSIEGFTKAYPFQWYGKS